MGYPVDLVDMEGSLEFAQNMIKEGKGGHILTLNPEMIMQGNHNPDLSEILKQADIIIPDGIGIIIALKKLGLNNIKQIPGIEFSQNLIKNCSENKISIGFIGASKR